MDGPERDLLERSLRHATTTTTGAELDGALAALGWPDALAVDRRTAVSLLFEMQGSANASSSALERVIGHALGVAGDMGHALEVAGVGAAGLPAPGVVLPGVGSWAAPGDLRDGRLRVAGLATAGFADRSCGVVVASAGDHHVTVVVPTPALTLRPVAGVDPRLGLVEVSGDTPSVPDHLDAPAWPAAVVLARLAIGHELVGASRQMLALAREHALGRLQFGQPIATYQAVRHRLADTLVAIEGADALLGAAWDDLSPETAAMAKAMAGRAGRTAARHCQQVLAGIGFTTEHPLHRYVRRVLVLDELFGSARTLTNGLGTELIGSRRLPDMLPL